MILLLKVRPLLGVLAVAYVLRRKYPARPARSVYGTLARGNEMGHLSRG